MRKTSLRWRITFLSLVMLILTCVSMKIMICTAGQAQMTELGRTVQLFDEEHQGKEVSSESLTRFTQDFSRELSNAKMQFCMYNWYITGTVIVISSVVVFYISRRSLDPLKRFSEQLEEIQMKNLTNMRMKKGHPAELEVLRKSLNDMLDRISRAFEAQHQFTSNAAHELRTPLALMQAQLDICAEENAEISGKMSDTITMIREQTERLSNMVRILLEMSELQTVPCSDLIRLAPMIEEILTDLASLAEEDNITLEQFGEDYIVRGSDILIYRVIFNLVENAIKYNRKGGNVSVTTSHCSDKVHVSIADTGHGIPDESRENVFQPFFRADTARNRTLGGIGLGLSLVWEIVNLHEGTVSIQESNESGTIVLLEFPHAL